MLLMNLVHQESEDCQGQGIRDVSQQSETLLVIYFLLISVFLWCLLSLKFFWAPWCSTIPVLHISETLEANFNHFVHFISADSRGLYQLTCLAYVAFPRNTWLLKAKTLTLILGETLDILLCSISRAQQKFL